MREPSPRRELVRCVFALAVSSVYLLILVEVLEAEERGQGGQLFLLVGLCLVPAQSLPTRGHVCTHLVVLHTA